MPAKVLSLNERSPYEPFQRKALNVRTLRGDEADCAGKHSSFASRHVELGTVSRVGRLGASDLYRPFYSDPNVPVPDLVRKNRSKIILNGDHPHVEARWENANDRRICVTVRPITRKLVRLVHEHSSGDFSKIFYEGYVRTNAEEGEPLRVEVKQVNSIIDDFGAAMTFWSTGVPEQVE